MSAHDHETPYDGVYLLTEDLPDKIEHFRELGLNTPGYHSFLYSELQDRLANALQGALPDGQSVYRVKMHKLATQVASFIDAGNNSWAGEDVLVVSTCPELAYPERGVSIQVNRLVDFDGEYCSLRENGVEKRLPIGPRPGQPPLYQQIADVVEVANGRRLVIAEDGIFSGDTLKVLITALQDSDVEIAGIVTGFRFQLGSNSVLDGLGIPVHVVHPEIKNLIDWVPDHDFIPAVPGCGKVLGCVVGEESFPFVDHAGATFSVPYVAPFSHVTSWASLPASSVDVFSKECLAISAELYTELDRLNPDRAPLRFRDIMNSPHQRVSIPVSVTRPVKHLPSSSTGVVEFLDGLG